MGTKCIGEEFHLYFFSYNLSIFYDIVNSWQGNKTQHVLKILKKKYPILTLVVKSLKQSES